MTSAAYVAKRLERLAAELARELARPTLKNHPSAVLVESLADAQVAISNAAYRLGLSAPETPAVAVSPGDSAPVRFVFIAVGRDAEGRDTYAQDEAGTVWASAAFGGIACAHRFPTRAAALAIAEKRDGHAYPIPA